MSEPGSGQRGTHDREPEQASGSGGHPQAADGDAPREQVRIRVDPIKASIVLGAIAAIILGAMYFTQYSTPLFNLQLLIVILTVSLLASIWLSYLIAGPGVAQLRGKVGDFAVDVGGPFAAFLAIAVLLFYGHVHLLTQWWSQLPIQDPDKLKKIIAEHEVYQQVIPSRKTLKRLADVLEEYPPAELERVTAQYRYLMEGIGGSPDFKKIVELIKRSEKQELLRTRILGQYCYFARADATEAGGEATGYQGRLAIEPDTDHPFIKISGRSNGFRFSSEFFSVSRDGMLYQWGVEEEAGGRPVSIGFAKLSFTDFESSEDRAVSEMKGKFTTFKNRAGVITLVRNIGGGGRNRDYCALIAPDHGYSGGD